MMEIGGFQIDLEMRALWRDGEAVRLGSRAFDILALVAAAGGRLVTKDEVMNAVWPDTVVEENNIHVHLSALRKALGADRDLLLTVPGRGYQLLPRKHAPGAHTRRFDGEPAHSRGLPPLKSTLLGRDAEIATLRAMLRDSHVLTIVGAGGIGKTRLAIEAARASATDFSTAVSFVELAALTTPEAVLGAIAESCGLSSPASSHVQIEVARVAAALAGQTRLLLLDNAEHVIGTVAQIVDTLVASNANLRVLVTSREPLRIMAERMFRVEPLDFPAAGASDADILRCAAVHLFIQRADSLQERVAADSAQIRLVGEICRRLDGMPLAIELAAARVAALGVEGVCRRLDDRMAILAGGYRTALPRHQTLRATFDWSFALLDRETQCVFWRLALFRGRFSFESMCAAVCDDEYATADAIGGIGELVAKSLVSVEFEEALARYRLSECTRAYALEKLRANGELREIIGRNARYLSRRLEARERAGDDPAAFAQTLDDARAALDWALSADGDARAGIELASHLAGALAHAQLFEECRMRAAQAARAIAQLPAFADTASERRLRAALAAMRDAGHETTRDVSGERGKGERGKGVRAARPLPLPARKPAAIATAPPIRMAAPITTG